MRPRTQGRRALWAVAAAGLLALRCASVIPEARQDQLSAFDPGERVTIDDLREGRRLYVAKCGGCHGLHSPADGTAAQWRAWVREMAPRAKIDPASERRILLYLRGALVPPPPAPAG